MSGSVDLGYGGKATPDPEYNVRAHPSSTAAMYTADWEVLIAPLDTAGLVRLIGERYQKILHSERPVTRALIENYRVWASNRRRGSFHPDRESSTLFDPVAVYLTFQPQACQIEELRLRVTEDGYTRRDEAGSQVQAALRWNDLEAFQNLLMERLR